MPYTTHGHWYGDDTPIQPGPRLVARCGGPHLCTVCAIEAHRGKEGTSVTIPVDPDTPVYYPAPGVNPATTTFTWGGGSMVPTVGRSVHYVSYGTPGGEYKSECRAATVTEVDPHDPSRVGLTVTNPTGLFFHPLAAGGCTRHDGDTGSVAGTGITTKSYPGGTWHWPERA